MDQDINQAAFFDIDHTLIKDNASRLFFNHFYKHKKVTLRNMFMMAFWSMMHRMNRLDEEQSFERAASCIKGWDVQETREICREAFDDSVKHRLSGIMKQQIDDHRKLGHKLVLVTSMPEIICEQFKDFFDMDDMLCSKMGITGGKFSGKILHLNYGKGKVIPLLDYAKKYEIDLSHSYFYGDSMTDSFAMDLVGHPIAVNPDNRLEQYAKEKGWRIMRH